MDVRPLLMTHFDSAHPRGLSSVVHVLRRPGRMTLEVLECDAVLASWAFTVAPPSPAGSPMAAATHAIDLAALAHGLAARGPEGPGCECGELRVMAEGGALQISSSAPRLRSWAGGYAARLRLADAPDGAYWSTDALQEGDAFSVVPLRPGWYRLDETHWGMSATVRVRYPDPRERARQLPPVVRRAGDADEILLACGQGLVLFAGSRSRFRLSLERADDGPADLARWKAEQDRALLRGHLATPRP